MSEIVHIIINDDVISSSSSSSPPPPPPLSSSSSSSISTSTFTDEEVSIICKSAEEGVASLIENALNDKVNSDGNCWVSLFENKELDLKVYNSETKNCPIKKFKAICTVPFSPKRVQEFISNNEHRLTWDRNVCALTDLIVKQEDKKKVILLRSATNKVGPIAGMTFYLSSSQKCLQILKYYYKKR